MKSLLIILIIALIPFTFSSCFYLELEFEHLEELTDPNGEGGAPDSGDSDPDDDGDGGDDNPIILPSDLTVGGYGLGTDNSNLMLFYSGPVYSNSDSTGALTLSDFELIFYSNGGEVTTAVIGSVFHTAGSDMIQLYFIYDDDEADGVEEIEIRPVDSCSIFDGEGKAIQSTVSTGRIRLNAID